MFKGIFGDNMTGLVVLSSLNITISVQGTAQFGVMSLAIMGLIRIAT